MANDIMIENLPLPMDVPQPPSLDRIPPRILHSATVEALISHNEDLSSRLKVHIRRNSQLEGQLVELELELEEAELARQSLSSQIEILREKDRAFAEKSSILDGRLERLTDDLALTRLENTELHKKNRDFSLALLTREKQMGALKRRLERWVRPGLTDRKAQITTLTQQLDSHSREIERLNAALSVLRQELQHSRTEADRKTGGFEKDRARLVEQYETTIQILNKELKTTQGDLAKANEKAATLDRMTSETARTANERVFFERRSEELEDQLKVETVRLRGTIEDLAKECATLRASNETQRRLKDELENRLHGLETEQTKATSQLQSMREIWKETSLRAQALESKNEALEKLNAELSKKLMEKREAEHVRIADQALDQVGFVESDSEQNAKLKKMDLILSDLEMRAFGIDPAKTDRTADQKAGKSL